MPRSNVNWASKVRAAYLEDSLIQRGYTNRQQLTEYFGTEKSLGSMDITAYGFRTAIRKASAGEVMPDGTVVVGYKLGGSLLWVRDGAWFPVTNPTPERAAAWGLLPHGYASNTTWLNACMSAWLADKQGAAGEMAEYFGITPLMASKFIAADLGVERDAERAGIWGYFG